MTTNISLPLLAALILGSAALGASEQSFEPRYQPLEPLSPYHRAQPTGTAQPMLPDLVLDDVRLDESCHVLVQIRNDGPGALGADVWADKGAASVGITLKQGGVTWGSEPIWRFDSVRSLQSAGGKATYFSTLGVAGSQSITATVDGGNRVPERKETNNERTEQLRCHM